jgi:integrase
MRQKTNKTNALVLVSSSKALEQAQQEIEQVEKLVQAAKSKATRRGYAADWRLFEGWAYPQGLSSLPLEQTTVVRYVTHLFTEGAKVKTIERALAGIVFHQRSSGFSWQSSELLKETMAGIRRTRAEQGERTTKKQAITKVILVKMLETLDISTLSGLRDRAILLLAWTAAGRRSEITELDVGDVEFTDQGMIIRPKKTKTDQEGKETEKGIPLAVDARLCATRAVQAWVERAGIESGPLFRGFTLQGKLRETALTSQVVAFIVKKACLSAGLDHTKFSGHSLRAGLITEAADQDVDENVIARQSGHRSVAILRGYIRHAELFKKNAAKGLL